jgi:hypothetical protein
MEPRGLGVRFSAENSVVGRQDLNLRPVRPEGRGRSMKTRSRRIGVSGGAGNQGVGEEGRAECVPNSSWRLGLWTLMRVGRWSLPVASVAIQP